MRKIAPILIVAGGILAWVLHPEAVQWAQNPAPVTMTMEDYMARGSDAQWLILKDVYVDASNRVSTVWEERGVTKGPAGSYFPLRAGPGDTRPVKLFLMPTNYSESGGVVRLGAGAPKEGESWPEGNPLQEVRGTVQVGIHARRELPEILRKGNLKTVENPLVIKQGAAPADTLSLAAMVGVPAALILGGIAGLFVGRKKPRP